MRVAVVNDYEIVTAGVAAMLAEHAQRVLVVDVDWDTATVDDVDVILFDTFANLDGVGPDVLDLLDGGAKVAVYAWTGTPDAIAAALEQGASGYLAKGLSSVELVEALEFIAAGKEVVSPVFEFDPDRDSAHSARDWPGRSAGLTAREAEILAFIARGLSNEEIARGMYLSINTVKTYIRTAYRKIGATRRSQAVVWALRNGFAANSRQRS